MDELKTLESQAGGYSVEVPEGWTALAESNKVSAESQDKKIALDYVRDARLTEAKMRQMLATNGAQLLPDVKDDTVDGVKVKTLQATIGSVRRMATLHQPATGPAALSMLETTEDTLKELDDDLVEQMLVENLKLAAVAATPAPATPKPAQAGLPTPQSAAPAPATPVTAEKTPGATAAASPSPAAASPASATPAATAAAASGTKAVQSKALGVTVNVAESWKGDSDEADAMVTLADNKGLEIRIARDEGDLDPKETFGAMKDEGWKEEGLKSDSRFQAAEFSKDGQNLLLVLVPEKSRTTLVLYATASTDFTTEQRQAITSVIQQVIPAQ